MFEKIPMAPPDKILGLTEAFKKDPRPNKVNLGVGVYKDEANNTPVFDSVKKAEEILLKTESSKTYLGIPGDPQYGIAVQKMIFGDSSDVVSAKRAVTAHTPGGTAALRVAADYIKKMLPDARIWVSSPTWENHSAVFKSAGLDVMTYPYYDEADKCLAFDDMMATLKSVPAGDVVLLHACCHNPTGMDPDADQWKQIAAAAAQQGFLPFVDFAYQGLGDGLEEDAAGVRILAQSVREMIIASSFSKNFGLYNERVGALTIVSDTEEVAQCVFSQMKVCIRTNYSNPPSHGGAIVTTVLNNPELCAMWKDEVKMMCDRINGMRRLFVDTLKAKGVERDFSFIATQKGMFSFSGLTSTQVDALREKHAVYAVGSGRINVAALTPTNMEYVCQAIADVL